VAITRRRLFTDLAGVASAATIDKLGAHATGPSMLSRAAVRHQGSEATFPRKEDFDIAEGYTYMNGAFTHPMPIAATHAFRAAVDRRSKLGTSPARRAADTPR